MVPEDFQGQKITKMLARSNNKRAALSNCLSRKVRLFTPLQLIHNGTVYNYVLNLQGDVQQVRHTNGTVVATYLYNAWGQVIQTSGWMADINPLRYRGYYFDTITALYYLQSRYYDPWIGRFINADAYVSTGQLILGFNMFAYCNNNPVNMVDPDGYNPIGTLRRMPRIWRSLSVSRETGGAIGLIAASTLVLREIIGTPVTNNAARRVTTRPNAQPIPAPIPIPTVRIERQSNRAPQYQAAWLNRATGHIATGSPLTFDQARDRVLRGGDIMAANQGAAFALVSSIPGGSIGLENHGRGRPGYFWHYHVSVSSNPRVHIWFLGPRLF